MLTKDILDKACHKQESIGKPEQKYGYNEQLTKKIGILRTNIDINNSSEWKEGSLSYITVKKSKNLVLNYYFKII